MEPGPLRQRFLGELRSRSPIAQDTAEPVNKCLIPGIHQGGCSEDTQPQVYNL